MPGMAALITKLPREQAMAELCRMMATLRHEPSYCTGTLIDEAAGVYVGWTLRESDRAAEMPLRGERGDVAMVFSGEEFPQPETLRRLRSRRGEGSGGGLQYVVDFYEEDSAFPAGLNGRFHGLVIDRKRNRILLFNDRYGMHRVYYHEGKDSFYCAAEAKAILAVRPEVRRLDSRGFGEFIACGAVLENRTLFEGVNVLPPASAWTFQGGRIERKGVYFQPREWEDQEKLDPESWYKELKRTFTQNLPRYFDRGQRIGVSLTGGLDTRMIMAWQKAEAGSLPCYTFGGVRRNCRDVVVARRVANICGQSHEVITVGQEFLSRFPAYAERTIYLSDGCVDVGRSPDPVLNERAREIRSC